MKFSKPKCKFIDFQPEAHYLSIMVKIITSEESKESARADLKRYGSYLEKKAASKAARYKRAVLLPSGQIKVQVIENGKIIDEYIASSKNRRSSGAKAAGNAKAPGYSILGSGKTKKFRNRLKKNILKRA